MQQSATYKDSRKFLKTKVVKSSTRQQVVKGYTEQKDQNMMSKTLNVGGEVKKCKVIRMYSNLKDH